MRRTLAATAVAVLASCAAAHAAVQTPLAIFTDPPPDKTHPAAMDYVRVPSHGALMNGVLYSASGAGPHPAVVLLHGFPGNEQNLDLAQAMRRAGFDVLTLHYRGSWGSPGAFSFQGAIDDADAAVAFLKAPASVAKYRLDPRHLYVVGHSMGGFLAANAAAHDPAVAGLVMISAWDIGAVGPKFRDKAYRQKAAQEEFNDDVIPLAGTSADRLMDEAAANAARWEFVSFAPQLKTRPVLLVTADDGSNGDSHRLAEALGRAADPSVEEVHLATDHPYSDHRIALETAVVTWLQAQAVRR